MNERPKYTGPFWEDFHEGQEFEHVGSSVISPEYFAEQMRGKPYLEQPIHSDPEFARKEGYRDIVVPGPIVLDAVFQLTVNDLSFNARNKSGSFDNLSAVYMGDELRARSRVVKVEPWTGKTLARTHGAVFVETTGYNQDGIPVIVINRLIANPLRAEKSSWPFDPSINSGL